VQRLAGEIKPAADRIMNVLLQILSSVGAKSSVPDTVFAVVGALANALEDDFAKYMEAFTPFLYNALGNREEPGLCAMAIGLVSDITRALQELSEPYCDTFMNYLLGNLSVSELRGVGVIIKLMVLRTNPPATNFGLRSSKLLGISPRQLGLISRSICLWSLRCYKQQLM